MNGDRRGLTAALLLPVGRRKALQFEYLDPDRLAFDHDTSERTHTPRIAQFLARGIADDDVRFLPRPDIAENHLRGIQADADIERWPAFRFPSRIEIGQRGHHVESGMRGKLRVRTVRGERAPVRHYAVADELVYDPVIAKDNSNHELLKVATDVSPADVAIPAGFKEKK